MNNMMWISFFLTLLSGAITALIGVHIQHWYSKKKVRERLIEALRNELILNISRIDKNVKYLQQLPKEKVDIRKVRLIVPFLTRVYEALLIEDPSLFYELSKKTHGQLDEVYKTLVAFNSHYHAMVFGMIHYTDARLAIENLNKLKIQIDVVVRGLLMAKRKKLW